MLKVLDNKAWQKKNAGGLLLRLLGLVMSKTLTKRSSVGTRLATLETEFEALRDKVLGLVPVAKDWRSTVGMLPDDAMTRRAFKAGAQWRKAQKSR